MRYVKALLPLLAVALVSCVVTYKASLVDSNQRDSSSTKNIHAFYHIKPISDKQLGRKVLTGIGYFLGVLNLPNPLIWYEYPSTPTSCVLSNPWGDLERELVNHQLFLRAIETDSPPQQGIYFSVDAAYYPKTIWEYECPSFLSVFTLGILPYYCDKAGVAVRYDLFIDHQQKKSYQYQIAKKGAAGLLLLPFAWANLFTDDLADGILLTVHQFLLDAERDGYFNLGQSPR